MNKFRNTTKTNSGELKKTMANFVRKSAKLETSKKTPIFESNLDKMNVWNKKPDNTWDY